MNLIFRSFPFFFRCICLFFLVTGGQQISFAAAPLLKSHVDDQAKYLGANHLSIERKLTELERDTGYQVIFMTREEIGESDSVEGLGLKEFRRLKLGQNGKDDGVLFLIVTNYKRMHLEVGGDVEGFMKDSKATDAILTAMTPKVDFENEGVVAERAVDAIILLLRPDLWSSLRRPRTVPDILILLALNAALIFVAYLGVKKYRSW